MKSWFAKLRMSVALDRGQKPSGRLREKMRGAAELGGFEADMTALDHALKETAPKAQAPASLHRSIMRAVQAAERPALAQREPTVLRWLAAPVLAMVALLLVWHALRGPVRPTAPDTQSLAAATSALEAGGQMARAVPSAVVAPLSDELARLNRDLDNTAQFLLASLP